MGKEEDYGLILIILRSYRAEEEIKSLGRKWRSNFTVMRKEEMWRGAPSPSERACAGGTEFGACPLVFG